jgi:hypothetical protein
MVFPKNNYLPKKDECRMCTTQDTRQDPRSKILQYFNCMLQQRGRSISLVFLYIIILLLHSIGGKNTHGPYSSKNSLLRIAFPSYLPIAASQDEIHLAMASDFAGHNCERKTDCRKQFHLSSDEMPSIAHCTTNR